MPLNGPYRERDLELKEHIMAPVIANASNTGHGR
jgi:hypothetical protein